MNKAIQSVSWWTFGFLCVTVGLFPITYFLIDRHFGLLSYKSQALLEDQLWNFFFYGHIVFGGIALLIGWTQFSSRLRKTRLQLHRKIGKVYVISVLVSGICGLYIAQFATGGIINIVAFSTSGILWLVTTLLSYKAIRQGQVELHENYMIYSYAICFSAVTLRIWLSIFVPTLGEFESAYLISGWLSWVPNVLVAYFIIKWKQRKAATKLV